MWRLFWVERDGAGARTRSEPWWLRHLPTARRSTALRAGITSVEACCLAEKLHIRRHHDRRDPIFHGKPQLVARLAFAELFSRQLVERRQARTQKRQRDRLRLVEDDHGPREIVQPPAP